MRVDHKNKEADFSNITSSNNYDNNENTIGVINSDWRLGWGSSHFVKAMALATVPGGNSLHNSTVKFIIASWQSCYINTSFPSLLCSLFMLRTCLNLHFFFSLFNDLLIEMCRWLSQVSSHFLALFPSRNGRNSICSTSPLTSNRIIFSP